MNNESSTDSKAGRLPSRRAVAAAGVAALVVPRYVLGQGRQAPSDTLRIAAVGIGGMGRRYMEGCAGERFVALCDIDQDFAAPVFNKYPEARRYTDYRQMFDKEEKNIDAVIVATPDHSHAQVTLRALRMGKHVYSAKPLTHNIAEARRVAAAAREAKVTTQMSVQSCGGAGARSTTEILLSGVLGPIREVHFWVDHPLYPAGLVRPGDTPAVPDGFTWDLWIGPAPFRPYHPAYHPWIWRSWWDFGSGTVGDMACHAMHIFHQALKLGSPEAITGYRTNIYTGPMIMHPDGKETLPQRVQTPETESHASTITWDFPPRDGMPPLRLHWYDGGMKPHRPIELDRAKPMPNSGLLFVGEKGQLLSGYSGGNNQLLPGDRFRDFKTPPKTLPRTANHYKEFTEGCKTGKPTACPFEFGSRMTEIALLGTLAARTARLLEYDGANMRITNDAEANALIDPPYRKGWEL